MTEDELRRAYGALRRQERDAPTADAEHRPSPEAIWSALSGDLEPGERVRILDEALKAGAADDIALAHSLRTAALSAAGHAQAAAVTRRGVFSRRWPMAAAAALVAAVSVPLLWRTIAPPDTGDGESRRYRDGRPDSAVRLAAPSGDVPLPADGRFVWSALPEARAYVFEALDSSGRTITSVTTTDTLAVLPDSVSAATKARIAGWWVTATLSTGAVQRSELRTVTPAQRP